MTDYKGRCNTKPDPSPTRFFEVAPGVWIDPKVAKILHIEEDDELKRLYGTGRVEVVCTGCTISVPGTKEEVEARLMPKPEERIPSSSIVPPLPSLDKAGVDPVMEELQKGAK